MTSRPRASSRGLRLRTVSVACAVLACVISLTACGFSITPTNQQPTSDKGSPVTGTDFSTLTPGGIAQILESKQARFDMRDGTIQKARLGLADDEYAPDVQSRDGLIRLEILGPEATVVASTDRIRFFTTDAAPDVKRITYFLVADTKDEFFQLLRDASNDYGIDSASVESYIDSVERDPNDVNDYALPLGDKLGMNVSYDLRYDGSASVQVAIVQVYPLP